LNHELLQVAEEKGFHIDVVPFIRTEAVPDMKGIIQNISSQLVTVIFTSMNAAEAVIKELNGFKPLWRIFCIGNTTRSILIHYFGVGAISGYADNASNLAYTIIETTAIQEVIFFCGDQRRDELPIILSEKHIKIQEVVVYKTILLNYKIVEEYKGILFFSPSAVSSFFSNNTIDKHTILFAIGETTAGSIRSYSNNTIVVSESAGKENLVNTMITYYESLENKNQFVEKEN